MPVTHLASDELLLAHAAGRLSPAPALVLASHLAMSEESTRRYRAFERLGGALLDEQPMADLSPDLFDRMLARIGEAPQEGSASRLRGNLDSPDIGLALPPPLAAREIGRWRLMGPGMRFAKVEVPEDPDFKVVLLRIGAGRMLPQHGHSGSELTLVLKGRFGDENASYGPGDIEEEDSDSTHTPRVEPHGECICLTAIEGSLRPHGWLARVMMPLLGF